MKSRVVVFLMAMLLVIGTGAVWAEQGGDGDDKPFLGFITNGPYEFWTHSAAAIEILEELNAKKVVMHCFSGKKKLIERCIKNKWSLSIPTNIVRNQQFQDMAAMIPLNQILTETDSPFLTHDFPVTLLAFPASVE